MTKSVAVTLASGELHIAAEVGKMRELHAINTNAKHSYGSEHSLIGRFDKHIEGAAAEMAVAKHLKVYWSGNLSNLFGSDVGEHEVRSTRRPNGALILHEDDTDDALFFLVTGTAPFLTIVGWIPARDGKQQRFWKDPTGNNRPAFFVPQSFLYPMTDFDVRAYVPA